MRYFSLEGVLLAVDDHQLCPCVEKQRKHQQGSRLFLNGTSSKVHSSPLKENTYLLKCKVYFQHFWCFTLSSDISNVYG